MHYVSDEVIVIDSITEENKQKVYDEYVKLGFNTEEGQALLKTRLKFITKDKSVLSESEVKNIEYIGTAMY